jgi:hypothetical protein
MFVVRAGNEQQTIKFGFLHVLFQPVLSVIIKCLCLDKCARNCKLVRDQKILEKGSEKLEEKLEISYFIKKLNDLDAFELHLDSDCDDIDDT